MYKMKFKHSLLGGIVVLIATFSACQMDYNLLEEVDTQVKESLGAIDRELSISASGNGTVSPSGSVTVQEKDILDITAIPQSGYSFIRWEKVGGEGSVSFGDSTQAATTVKLRGGTASIQAVFSADTYTLTIDNDGNGTTSPAGAVTVDHGTARSISATPATGYEFSGWTVTNGSASFDNASSASTTVTLAAGNTTIRANFTITTYTMTMSNDGNGSTNPSGQSSVDYDRAYTIRAYPSRFYSFAGWVQSGGSGTAAFTDASDRTTEVRVTGGDVTVEATFNRTTYALEKRADLLLNVSGHVDTVYEIEVDGNYLFLGGANGSSEGTVMRIDISNPANPFVTHYTDTLNGSTGRAQGLAINSNYIFVADSYNGIYRFDKNNLGSRISDTSIGGINDVEIHGNSSSVVLAIQNDRLYAYESYSSSMTTGGYAQLADSGHRVAAYSDYAFVTAADYDNGAFYSIDASATRDQGWPILDTYTAAFGSFGEQPGNMAMYANEMAYMTGDTSIVALEIDGPSSMGEAADDNLSPDPFDLAIGEFYGNKTFFYKALLISASKDSSGSYTIMEISNTSNPYKEATYSTWSGYDPEAITIDGNYLYTVEKGDTIVIYEIVIDP